MTLPMSFKVKVAQSSPALFCRLRAMTPIVISSCQGPGIKSHDLTCYFLKNVKST